MDTASRLPPLDHRGKPAVRAVVYTTDGGSHRWVQYLFRYKGADRARPEASPGTSAGFGSGEIKRPRDSDWVGETDPTAGAIMLPRAPDGFPAGQATQMFP